MQVNKHNSSSKNKIYNHHYQKWEAGLLMTPNYSLSEAHIIQVTFQLLLLSQEQIFFEPTDSPNIIVSLIPPTCTLHCLQHQWVFTKFGNTFSQRQALMNIESSLSSLQPEPIHTGNLAPIFFSFLSNLQFLVRALLKNLRHSLNLMPKL